MTICLEVINGRYAGSTCLIEPGDVCRIGSRAQSDLWLADDRFTEPSHCVVARDRKALRIHDLSTSGTFVNKERIDRARELRHGDWFVVGTSVIFALERGKSEEEIDTVTSRLTRFLSAPGSAPLWYLGEDRGSALAASLLSGLGTQNAERVEEGTGVWLARIPRDWSELPWLIRSRWGKGHGIFLRSLAKWPDLLAHFRAVISARPGVRIFDPRLLRVLLPECDESQRRELFAPVHQVIVESQLPHSALAFEAGSGGKLKAELVRFCDVRPLIPRQQELRDALKSGSLPAELLDRLGLALGATTRSLDDHRAGFVAYRLSQREAQIQFALLDALYGRAISPNDIGAVLKGTAGSSAETLDRYVALLNERRG